MMKQQHKNYHYLVPSNILFILFTPIFVCERRIVHMELKKKRGGEFFGVGIPIQATPHQSITTPCQVMLSQRKGFDQFSEEWGESPFQALAPHGEDLVCRRL